MKSTFTTFGLRLDCSTASSLTKIHQVPTGSFPQGTITLGSFLNNSILDSGFVKFLPLVALKAGSVHSNSIPLSKEMLRQNVMNKEGLFDVSTADKYYMKEAQETVAYP